MESRYFYRKIKRNSFFIIKTILLGILSAILIWFGANYGKKTLLAEEMAVEKVDTGVFKNTLNHSWPIIDLVYNSGNINVTFGNEIKEIINKIFKFDLRKPITILNTQYPILYTYYVNNYLPYLEEKENENLDYKLNYSYDESSFQNGVASSIYMDEEKKDLNPDEGSSGMSNSSIIISNETRYKVDVDALMKEPLKLNLNKKGPKILIYHTHTTESYINNLGDLEKKDASTSLQDQRCNVVQVGDELTQYLENTYKIDVIHNGTIHDSPNYNSAYNNALKTVTSILKSYPSIGIVLDIHRDGLGTGSKLRLTKTIGNKTVAQIMFVVATGEIGLSHPNWKENLKFALKLQENLNNQCPGLARPIYISKYRYNQHVSNGALIVEIGGDGNTLEEALESTKYLAKAINDVVNQK